MWTTNEYNKSGTQQFYSLANWNLIFACDDIYFGEIYFIYFKTACVTHNLFQHFMALCCAGICACDCAFCVCTHTHTYLSWAELSWVEEDGIICENPICSVYSFATFYDLYIIISCFLFVFKWQTSQVFANIFFVCDSEFYESFGKWNPMVAFLMWLPHGNFHIVPYASFYISRFVVYTNTTYKHDGYVLNNVYTKEMCLYRQYRSFICVCVCARA